jgi:hypothetical protein
LELPAWPPEEVKRARAAAVLESGGVVSFPLRGFELEPAERPLLDPRLSGGRVKNISFDSGSALLGGARVGEEERATLARMMARFAGWAEALVLSLAPGYEGALRRGKTSFRPCQVEGRPQSPRKDDTRLHVDAFRAQPTQGRRILRVFANINPAGEPRIWETGEPFEAFARRFARRLRPMRPGEGWLLERLGATRGRRTPYDHLMLGLHDFAKLDDGYRRDAARRRVELTAGGAWLTFTDATLHAALGGQHALEQTFFLPVEAMADPGRSPLRILERLTGRRLV